jgi:hypothetical protein
MGLRVEEGGESEGQPVMGWIGIAPGGLHRERSRKATSPHAKAGRYLALWVLPPGRSSRESLAKHLERESRPAGLSVCDGGQSLG